MRCALLPLSLLLLLACDDAVAPRQATALTAARFPGVAPQGVATGALVYVPVYSSVFGHEGQTVHDLTVMLSARNTDEAAPIVITSARYLDAAGQELHRYAEGPVVVGPLGSAEALVAESDTRAGMGGTFLVEWRADAEVSEPIIEAVMVGTGHQQGISFVSEGRVVRRFTASAPTPGQQPAEDLR